MKETDDLLLFIERMAQLGVVIDKECRREWLANFTENELKAFMIKLYQNMIYFINDPYSYMGRGKIFEKLSGVNEPGVTFARYKYKCANRKNLRSIFIIQPVNNEYKAVFLHTFLEDGDKNKSNGSKSYKQAIKISKNRLKNYLVEEE